MDERPGIVVDLEVEETQEFTLTDSWLWERVIR